MRIRGEIIALLLIVTVIITLAVLSNARIPRVRGAGSTGA